MAAAGFRPGMLAGRAGAHGRSAGGAQVRAARAAQVRHALPLIKGGNHFQQVSKGGKDQAALAP